MILGRDEPEWEGEEKREHQGTKHLSHTHARWTPFLSETGKGLGNFPFLSTSSYSYLTKSIARTNFITSLANLIPVESVDRFPNQGTDTLRSELDRVATTGLGHTWTGQDSIRGSITRHPDCTREISAFGHLLPTLTSSPVFLRSTTLLNVIRWVSWM